MQTAKNMLMNLVGVEEERVCEVCGSEYDGCLEVRLNGETHIFDCFECAIHALAPKCARCGCQIIGHGLEVTGIFFCSTHCARQNGVFDMEDRTIPERSPA
jgi:hypothetical protein